MAVKLCSFCRNERGCPCAGLPREAACVLHPYIEEFHIQPGQVLVEPGGNPIGLVFINSGVLQVFRHDKSFRRRTVALRRNGHICGVTSLLLGKSPIGVAAVTVADICHIPRFRLLHNLHRFPSIGLLLLQQAAEESRIYAGQAMALSLQNARQRIAASLLLLALGDLSRPVSPISEIPLFLNRQQIANMLGLSRQHIAAIITSFEANGLVQLTRRKLVVTDLNGLFEVYEGGADASEPLLDPYGQADEDSYTSYPCQSCAESAPDAGELWLTKSARNNLPNLSPDTTY